MTSFSNINRFADRAMARMDELGDEAIQTMRNTPEAKARQAAMTAKMAASEKRAEAKRAKGRAAAIVANAFAVGDVVRHVRGMIASATVVAVEGSTITIEGGRKFAASAFVAA